MGNTPARQCSGTTKAGKPCRAKPMTDRDVCIAHADEKERVATGFGVNGGRPKKPRVVDVLRERIEQRIDEWLQPLDDALTASRSILIGAGEDAQIIEVPDHAIRLKAFAEAMDRSYGRPKQQTEISGPDGEPVRVEAPTDEAWHGRVAEVLAKAGAVPAPAVNGSSNGHGNGHGPAQD